MNYKKIILIIVQLIIFYVYKIFAFIQRAVATEIDYVISKNISVILIVVIVMFLQIGDMKNYVLVFFI